MYNYHNYHNNHNHNHNHNHNNNNYHNYHTNYVLVDYVVLITFNHWHNVNTQVENNSTLYIQRSLEN